MANSGWLITATPPTPNGDLHVGHMSGPYLAADIFKRACVALGDSAVYVCYGDDNQSYVVTTADRLKTDPNELMDRGNSDIQATLNAYDIDMDQYTRPDDDHNKAVGDAIRLLIDRGIIVEKEVEQLFDSQSGVPLYEAFASGNCPVCLLETKGGICESCGHPNDPVDLIGRQSRHKDDKQFVIKSAKRLVLPIEDFREEIIEFYKTKRGVWRPHLIQLVDELLAKPLADYSISHPNTWGIPIGLPNWDGHVINVWAEMGLGLLHLLGRHRSESEMGNGRYVQFLGYDNSYFFAIVHPVLQFALARAGVHNTKLPEFIFTNEFYHLENKKFSTSQGHALWGRELLEHMCSDRARFYLALHGPELAESNFVLSEALEEIAEKLNNPLRRISDHIETSGAGSQRKVITDGIPEILNPLYRRYQYYCYPENFSASKLARITSELLLFIADGWQQGDDLCQLGDHLAAFRLWAELANPLMPSLSAKIVLTLSGATGPDCGRLIVVLREFLDGN